MCKIVIHILMGVLFGLVPTQAQKAASNEPYPLLPRDKEIELARSAGLAPWNQQATIYVLESCGFVKAVEGTNDFTCMVGRDYPGTRWPVCFDAEGADTILPRYLRETQLRLQGKSEEEVRRDTGERFRTGQYRPPRRPGIAYMLSRETITFNGEDLRWTPPHLMIYAPNATREQLGAVAGNPHSPMVLFAGDPHAYIIVFVRDELPPMAKVEAENH